MKRESGLTLIDVTIATAIVIAIVGMAYPGFKTANDTMATNGRQDRMERQGDRALRMLTREVRSGWITGTTAPGQAPSLTLRHVQGDVQLSDLAVEDAVPWAAAERTVRFRQLEEITEADEGTDINRDGDLSDRFSIGVLETVELVDGKDVVKPITGASSRVILALPSFAGDLDGDGVGDPLFNVNGRILEISIRLITHTEGGQLLQAVTHSRIRLRNTQE